MRISIDAVRIVKAGSERIADLEPMWKALHLQNQAIGPPWLGTTRSLDQSWEYRRRKYETWLKEAGAFVLLAEHMDKPIGYALVYLEPGSETWQTGDMVGVLKTLSILPEARNMGIGTALMNAVYKELRLSHISELTLSVLSTNTDALRFYQRHGFAPKLMMLQGPVPPE